MWIPCSHCVAQGEMPCQRSQKSSKGSQASNQSASNPSAQPQALTKCPLCPGAEASRLTLVICPCVSMRMPHVSVLFCFPCKENKPKANTACVSTSPEPWKPVIPLDRKDFRLNSVSTSRGSWLLRAWERAESTAERGVGGPREDSPTLGTPLPPFKADALPDPALFLSGPKLRPQWGRAYLRSPSEQVAEPGSEPRVLTPQCSVAETELRLSPRQQAAPTVTKVGQGVRAPRLRWSQGQVTPTPKGLRVRSPLSACCRRREGRPGQCPGPGGREGSGVQPALPLPPAPEALGAQSPLSECVMWSL